MKLTANPWSIPTVISLTTTRILHSAPAKRQNEALAHHDSPSTTCRPFLTDCGGRVASHVTIRLSGRTRPLIVGELYVYQFALSPSPPPILPPSLPPSLPPEHPPSSPPCPPREGSYCLVSEHNAAVSTWVAHRGVPRVRLGVVSLDPRWGALGSLLGPRACLHAKRSGARSQARAFVALL